MPGTDSSYGDKYKLQSYPALKFALMYAQRGLKYGQFMGSTYGGEQKKFFSLSSTLLGYLLRTIKILSLAGDWSF